MFFIKLVRSTSIIIDILTGIWHKGDCRYLLRATCNELERACTIYGVAGERTSRSGTEDAIKGTTEWLIPALDFRENTDPASRFERPASLLCSRRDPGIL